MKSKHYKTPLTGQQKPYNNFQPKDFMVNKEGEIFEVLDKLTYFCKSCECRSNSQCQHALEMGQYTLQSVQKRKQYEVTAAYVQEKYQCGEIKEITYTKGQWKQQN